MIFCYTLEVCLVIWMQYKLVCENLNCDLNWNLAMKFNSSWFFFVWLLSFKMSTLKSPIMMIGQCSGECWIKVWKLFRNVKNEHEWASYTHTICIIFHVLILKVGIICSEPSLVIVLKEFKCMCMSYIIINPWPWWIEIYEYFNEFINLCTFVDAFCIFVSIKHKIWNTWRLWSWLMSL